MQSKNRTTTKQYFKNKTILLNKFQVKMVIIQMKI